MLKRGFWFWASYALAVGLAIWASTMYSHLPPVVPTHWSANGTPNAFGPRSTMLWILLIILALPVLMDVVPRFDPRRKNYDYFSDTYQKLKFLIVLFFVYVYIIATLASLKAPFILNARLMVVGIGVLFMLLGNYLAKLRNNFFVGIRTPWTLSSDTVWRKTHRFGGWIFVVGGMIVAITGAVSPPNSKLFYLALGVLVISGVAPLVYSYLVFRQNDL